MSDFSIPGTGSDKYGTQKLIESLMKVERVPREKASARLKDLEKQKSVWQDVNQRLGTLRDEARALYSFRNPFNERLANSSDEDTLTATATREALEQTRTVLVKRAAAADRFLSAELAKDYRVPAGKYVITVGEKRIELRFAGGGLQEFADALTRKGGDTVRAQVIAVKTDTRSLVVESLKEGQDNRLSFEGDAAEFAMQTGIVEKIATSRRDFDPAKAVAWEKPLDASAKAEGGKLSLLAGGEARLTLPSPAPTQGMTLEIEYQLFSLPAMPVPVAPPGPSLEAVGSASYEGISVVGAPSASALPEWRAPPTAPVVEDRSMANVLAPDGKAYALPELQDGDGVQTLSVSLEDFGPRIAGLGFKVRDTTRRLEVVKARILDPTEAGGFRPLRPVSIAQDALVSVDGIEATRPSNSISDLVPGVTLNLKSSSDKPVKLKVEPNREAVKESLISLVGNYDKLMAQINILSRPDDTIIEQLTYLSEEEKKTAKERLGVLQGDSTLSLLRSSLQRTMMNPYPTKDGTALTLLSQIGIATDSRKPGAGQGYDSARLKGYLEIDEETLDQALQEHFEAARQLFGDDSDGDLIVDSGAAFVLDGLLKPYVETGGIVSLKTGTIDTRMASEKRGIEDLDRQLIVKEKELKRKYGAMESSLNRMEGVSGSIENFTNQGKK